MISQDEINRFGACPVCGARDVGLLRCEYLPEEFEEIGCAACSAFYIDMAEREFRKRNASADDFGDGLNERK